MEIENKYGSASTRRHSEGGSGFTLSSPSGALDISCAAPDAEVVVVWTERGGPPVTAPADDGGYGSKLLNRGMTIQLGGSIACDWSSEGVIVTLRMTKERLTK